MDSGTEVKMRTHEGGHDVVSRPAHYCAGGFEVIDIIEAYGLGYHLGNVIKYVLRCEGKGKPIEDLKKAQAYLGREIANREKVAASALIAQDMTPLAEPDEVPNFEESDPPAPPKPRGWTSGDDKRLMELYAENYDVPAIARKMHRSYAQVLGAHQRLYEKGEKNEDLKLDTLPPYCLYVLISPETEAKCISNFRTANSGPCLRCGWGKRRSMEASLGRPLTTEENSKLVSENWKW